MDDASREMIVKNAIGMYESLLKSVNDAGGNPGAYTHIRLDKMTVTQLISNLCTNGIRFVCVRPLVGPKGE